MKSIIFTKTKRIAEAISRKPTKSQKCSIINEKTTPEIRTNRPIDLMSPIGASMKDSLAVSLKPLNVTSAIPSLYLKFHKLLNNSNTSIITGVYNGF